MEKLIYLGVGLNVELETELISESPFGWNVEIVFQQDSWLRGQTMTLNNVTEVHHLFDDNDNSIAFESDIHSTGMTKEVKDIVSVIITEATEKGEDF